MPFQPIQPYTYHLFVLLRILFFSPLLYSPHLLTYSTYRTGNNLNLICTVVLIRPGGSGSPPAKPPPPSKKNAAAANVRCKAQLRWKGKCSWAFSFLLTNRMWLAYFTHLALFCLGQEQGQGLLCLGRGRGRGQRRGRATVQTPTNI